MIHLQNTETDETKTMTLTDFMDWFNEDCTGYISSVWVIQWVKYDHPKASGQNMTV